MSNRDDNYIKHLEDEQSRDPDPVLNLVMEELYQDREEEEEIIKIAEELHKSGRFDNVPWVLIKEDAADLYKAGFRFDG